ncbi:MAG: GNAT family N-acetyltransferase [Microscillaceae bacterium]|jgi:L-amino acid N-acyltransferase YncA|nr:GNAT family N-acetyltransferase [Microscillaceae bacterium]
MNLRIGSPTTDAHIVQMLELQKVNSPQNLTTEQLISQGFVTVRHHFDLLKRMNKAEPQVVALADEVVVGYALVMPESFRSEIPVLEPMFQMFTKISYKGRQLSDYQSIVMGQICIAEGYRGLGLFDQLYAQMQQQLSSRYEICITEVATRNQRSMRAHARVGFEIALEYTDATDTWALVVWQWG